MHLQVPSTPKAKTRGLPWTWGQSRLHGIPWATVQYLVSKKTRERETKTETKREHCLVNKKTVKLAFKGCSTHFWACPLMKTPWNSWIALKLSGILLPRKKKKSSPGHMMSRCPLLIHKLYSLALFLPGPTAWYHLQNKHWWILTQQAGSSFIFTFRGSACLPARFNVNVVTNTDFVSGCSRGKKTLKTFLDAKKSG